MSWDQAVLPADEFKLRLRRIQQEMNERELDTLLVFGSGLGYADLCYVSNYVSALQWGLAAIPSSGDPILLLGARAGSIEFQRTLTWIRDVRRVADAARMTKQVLLDIGSERIGLVGGGDCVPSSIYSRVSSAFSKSMEVSDQSKPFRRLRRRKSPREVQVIKRAHSCARTALEILLSSSEELTNYEASARAELSALKSGAGDVRIMTSRDDAHPLDLYPAEESCSHTKNLLAYVGAMYLGYWGCSYGSRTVSDGAARSLVSEVMDELLANCKEGAACSAIAESLGRRSSAAGSSVIPFLANSFGSGIGLDAEEEAPKISKDSSDTLEGGDVLSLRVGFVLPSGGFAIDSRTLLVGKNGSTTLL